MRLLSLVALASITAICSGCGGAAATKTVTVTVTGGSENAAAQTTTTPSGQGAQVDVAKVGFTQRGNSVSYGIVLENPSGSQSATNTTLAINLLDKSGHPLATESQTVPNIPPSASFYAGNETFVPKGEDVSELDVQVTDVEPTTTSEIRVPQVENLRIENLGATLGIIVHGEVVNELSVEVPAYTDVGVVFFSADGAVIGGTMTSADVDIPPGGRAAFGVSGFALPRAADIATMRGSVYF